MSWSLPPAPPPNAVESAAVSLVRASGFVLFRREGARLLYLTLTSARHGTVGVPKGKVDEGEDLLETAYRETEEECGLGKHVLHVSPFFRRSIRYEIKEGPKEAFYYLAETSQAQVRLSGEHSSAAWDDFGAASARIVHTDLRDVLRDAAAFLRDPALRGGFDPAQARTLLEERMGAGHPVLEHSRCVAEIARTLAEAWGGLDTDAVEAMAWVHDIGRSRTHGARHPIEGFRLVVEAGHAGYAPACITHATKGAGVEELRGDRDADAALIAEMAGALQLEALCDGERWIALADFLAIGAGRGTIDARLADLERRYGPADFIRRNAARAEGLRAVFEEATGRRVYDLLGI